MSGNEGVNMKFFPHAVIYLDILGFSCFVEEAEKGDNDKMNALSKLFNEVIPREVSSDGKNSSYPKDLGMICLSCSDSFIVSAPISDKSSYPALIAVSIKSIQIAHALLDMGFLVRGAIAVGNANRTDSNILGTGFQEAVNAEKKAGNPKIVLTESAEKALKELIEKGYPSYAIYAKDELGQVILNSLHPEKSYLPDPKGEITEYFGRYREIILNSLSHDNREVKEKWRWFAMLYEANVKYFSDLRMKIPSLSIDEELPGVTLNYLNPPEQNSDWMNDFKVPGVRFTLQYPKK
jgi:hypothetical protein